MILTIKEKTPVVGKRTFIADNATVIGDVEIGERCGIWFGAVIRGDARPIKIGDRTNVQDLCVLHCDDEHGLKIGDDVTIGHRAIVHGCKIGDNVLIGMGAVIMNGAKIGDNCIIGAGALVTERTEIPDGSLAVGFPAKVKRQLTEDEVEAVKYSAEHYAENAKVYLSK